MRNLLILDTNILILLFKLLNKKDRKTFKENLKKLLIKTKCKIIWIPRSVKLEFLVKSKRERIKRQKFLIFLKRFFSNYDIEFDLCPLYDKNRIYELEIKHELDSGEADALNQAYMILEQQIIRNKRKKRYIFISKIIILTNDKNVHLIKRKLPNDIIVDKLFV